jgi:hypothetical protein
MVKYVYFDDEKPSSVKAYVDAVVKLHDDEFELSIHHMSPRPWDEQIQLIRAGGYSGIILDLRLDIQAQWEGIHKGKKAQYRAEELAQKIRVDATEGHISDIPIVLWSTTQNLNNSGFQRDSTPKDLFDLKVIKTTIPGNAFEVRYKLIALSNAYREIANCYEGNIIQITKCLRLRNDTVESLDPRIFNYFSVDFKPPIHDVARYILDQIIRKPGLLISEELLAIRLGINREESRGWGPFASNILRDVEYVGVFSLGWRRFLNEEFLNWWRKTFPEHTNLKGLRSDERVALLSEKFNDYELEPLNESADEHSLKYWYRCVVTGLPVTQQNAFITHNPHRLPWQENTYLSKEAIRQRLDRQEGVSVDQLDLDRLESFKKSES